MQARARRVGVVAVLAAAGCSGEASVAGGAAGSGGSGSGAPAVELPYQPCPVETGVGEFAIELGEDYTLARGKVFDGVAPNLISETLASTGECQLRHLPPRICDPPCPVATQACGSDERCVPLPVARSVGSVTLSGLVVPVELSANEITGSYRPRGAALPHPGFEPGADLRLRASGGELAGFELRGWGVSPLELTTQPVPVAAGAPTRLAWDAPARPGPARVLLQLHVNNHGSSSAWLECDLPDTGGAEIPAPLIDALLARGRSGFPTITITRRTATSTSIDLGCVQLLVTSAVNAGVSVAGLTSCNDSSMCPAGQTCRAIERFCE